MGHTEWGYSKLIGEKGVSTLRFSYTSLTCYGHGDEYNSVTGYNQRT